MFPFGIQAEGSDPNRDERGPDTMNRLLLHGARYHDRRAVFESPEGGTPDWEADRLSIRVGLALGEELGIGRGHVVALALPMSRSWAVVERAVWGLGAATCLVDADAGPADVERTLAATGARALFARRSRTPLPVPVVSFERTSEGLPFSDLLTRGGVLDTPERATAFRAAARRTPSGALCSIELDGRRELSHHDWVERVAHFLARFPPARGRRLSFGETPDLEARVGLYAGWADGLTTVVLDRTDRGGMEWVA